MLPRVLEKFKINSSRVHLTRVNQEFAASIPAGALVLDAASGGQPYRKLFAHVRYESADFQEVDKDYLPSTYVCDIRAIPVEDGRFDAVIFNQGLEHMSEPDEVLKELNRILKPGGRMICTAPFFYEEHEQPYDFFRYTQFAYKHMLPKAGFKIESITWLEGYLGTVAYQMETAAKYLPKTALMLVPRILCVIMALLFYRMDLRRPYTASGFPKNYVVIAIK